MIKAYVGDFGSGKTLNMVWDLIQAMYRGRHVISNTPIECEFKSFWGKKRKIKAEFIPDGTRFFRALAYRENCIFAIDEVAVYLPNMYWSKLPPELIVKFAQNRKYRTDIYYTTQGFGMGVKRLRDLTHQVLLCRSRRVFGWKLFNIKAFKPEFLHGEPTEKKYNRYFLYHRTLYPSQVRVIFKAYNTNYVVDMSAMMHVKGFNQPTWNKTETQGTKIVTVSDPKEAESNRNEVNPSKVAGTMTATA
jgi:hypothetical protein